MDPRPESESRDAEKKTNKLFFSRVILELNLYKSKNLKNGMGNKSQVI